MLNTQEELATTKENLISTQEDLESVHKIVSNLTLQLIGAMKMRKIGIYYYQKGYYTNEQFALFVKRGFVTPEEYKDMTGVDYDPEKHMHKPTF